MRLQQVAMTVRMSFEERRELHAKAASEGVSANEYIMRKLFPAQETNPQLVVNQNNQENQNG